MQKSHQTWWYATESTYQKCIPGQAEEVELAWQNPCLDRRVQPSSWTARPRWGWGVGVGEGGGYTMMEENPHWLLIYITTLWEEPLVTIVKTRKLRHRQVRGLHPSLQQLEHSRDWIWNPKLSGYNDQPLCTGPWGFRTLYAGFLSSVSPNTGWAEIGVLRSLAWLSPRSRRLLLTL